MNVDTLMNGFNKVIIPYVNEEHHEVSILLDNAPCHRSKKFMEFMENNRLKSIDFGKYPTKSPDLNPIEHIWSLLQEKVALSHPKSTQHLKSLILDHWEGIDKKILRKCVVHQYNEISNVYSADCRWVE